MTDYIQFQHKTSYIAGLNSPPDIFYEVAKDQEVYQVAGEKFGSLVIIQAEEKRCVYMSLSCISLFQTETETVLVDI